MLKLAMLPAVYVPFVKLKPLGRSVRYCFRSGILSAFFGMAVANPAMALPAEFPPVTEPASSEHHVGKVIFAELVTPDIEAAKRFYAGLFGWSFRDIQTGDAGYAEALFDGQPVAGLIYKTAAEGGHQPPAWLTFLAVRDTDAAQTSAVQHGAKVLFAPTTIPGRGREAVFADPQGAVFAVLASASGDPPDVLVAPGEWIWSSLITSDPENGAAFYQALCEYEVYAASADDGARHIMLASDNYARASVNSLPADTPGNHSHWLNYIRVEDAVEMAAKAVALGGRVLVEPRVDRHGGKIAVLADPQGAPFGVLEWTDIDSKVVDQ